MPLANFHPAVSDWFERTFPAPTPAQLAAWDAIGSGRHALVAAPTGSGKTLAAFLRAIDDLVREGVAGTLADETAVLYVSPLKALSNDVRINLETPLAGIRDVLVEHGLPDVEIRSMVRTGDTPQAERAQMRKRPPHIVVTTPESLYILLGSDSGRRMLSTVRTVIVDEIHALAPNKRGSHLALTLERLEALCGRRLLRIGLSATQRPLDEVARFLVGTGSIDAHGTPDCAIVDVGHVRARDLAIELPASPLTPVMSNDVWAQVYDRLAALAREHRTTLVFVNTRRMAERAARHLSERLGDDAVAAHHGSMAREHRLNAEQKLKRGDLRILVATASLELGIDIGDVELVCQLGSPRAISAFLQRVGRSGHAVDATPKGRLFPQSRDDLVECAALLDAVRRGELDLLQIVPGPLDVLSQQIVAEVASRDCTEAELFELLRRAWPYARLRREDYTALVRMLADGFTTRRGPRAAYLHRDAVNGELRARKGARITAMTSGGAIPDTADYQVVLEPQNLVIGTLNEDFAVESLAGDVFQLGNASYRILRVEQGRVRVEDAQGQPPSIPFWLGEAPGRSDALSASVSRLREEFAARLSTHDDEPAALAWLRDVVGLGAEAAQQLYDYLKTAHAALGVLPTQRELAMERFFDESGGTQLVIHSPYGSRLNRAWGLALRKRFCRSFNFELQAAATEDAIILSLSTSHSFPLEEVGRYLHSNSVRDVLIQALLDAPMFGVRWRWNASTALALPRYSGGTKVAPQLQRMRSEDLLATVFPDQVACLENIVGEREIPDHPLVAQTLWDCLHDAMDIDGLTELLRRLEAGDAKIVSRELTSPSPLAEEVLNAKPYAYLDDAPLEERRTQAVMSRGWVDPATADDYGKLDQDAIVAVREDAWPDARDADEMHEALYGVGFMTQAEATGQPGWDEWLTRLAASKRAALLRAGDVAVWTTAERLPQLQALFDAVELQPPIAAPADYAVEWTREHALVELIRGRLTGLGPVTVAALAAPLALPAVDVQLALLALQREGYAMQGRYTDGVDETEWCERHLLARIHRYTVQRLRREIEPVAPRDLMRFLFRWQRIAPDAQMQGPDALAAVLTQLEGYEAPAGAWEHEILPARISGYDAAWLDELCLAGRIVWTRLRTASRPESSTREHASGPVRATPIVLVPRRQLPLWQSLPARTSDDVPPLSSRAQKVFDHLQRDGASFFDELEGSLHLLRTELEDALAELVGAGLVNSDSYAGLRALLVPASKRPTAGSARRGRRAPTWTTLDSAGRWSLVRKPAERRDGDADPAEHVAQVLLRRYGVVCWRMLEREAAWLPPWRELLRIYRRMEARGEVRGGRFVAGITGEQFALPDAVAALRKQRQQDPDNEMIVVSGADPLNLLGTLLPGSKVPSLTGSRVLYRDGMPIATLVGGEFNALPGLDAADEWQARNVLLRDTRQASRMRAMEEEMRSNTPH